METALKNGVTHLEIRTDSKYTIQCMYRKKRFFEIDELYWNDLAATEWISGWKRNNWIKKTDSKPVLNKDLMIKIDELQEKVKVKWVYHTVNFLHLFVFFLFDLDLCRWSFIKSRQ